MEKATAALIQSGLTTDKKMGYHHMSFFQGKNHLELHFNIFEDNEQVDRLLKNVWDNVYLKDGYEYRETNEFFVFHHIAHLVYHFLSGGCGIRPLIDLWIMKRKEFYSEEKVLPLLEQCDLVKFYRSVCKLAEVWLGDEKHDDLTMGLEKYIISGGVYGSEDNANAVGAVKYGGKIKYLLRLAFLPYKSMCIIYPSLKKFKVLLPFYYIHRIFYKLFGRDRKKAKEKINSTMSQSKENILSLNALLNELNLK